MADDLEKVIAGIIICAAITGTIANHRTRNTYQATVTEKIVKRYNEDSDKYLVFTKLEDGNIRVFENTDSLLEGKFNSSDLQAKLEEGKEYALKAYGWRIPFFSMYENIVGADEIKP